MLSKQQISWGQTSGAWVLMWVPHDVAMFGDAEKTKMDRKGKAFITSLKTRDRCRAIKANAWKNVPFPWVELLGIYP